MDRHVTVRLGEKQYQLNLTLSAMEKIEAEFGSLIEVRQRVAMQSLHAICRTIAAGANLSESQVKALKEEVFSAGVINVAPSVNAFIVRLHDPEDRGSEGDSDSGEA